MCTYILCNIRIYIYVCVCPSLSLSSPLSLSLSVSLSLSLSGSSNWPRVCSSMVIDWTGIRQQWFVNFDKLSLTTISSFRSEVVLVDIVNDIFVFWNQRLCPKLFGQWITDCFPRRPPAHRAQLHHIDATSGPLSPQRDLHLPSRAAAQSLHRGRLAQGGDGYGVWKLGITRWCRMCLFFMVLGKIHEFMAWMTDVLYFCFTMTWCSRFWWLN